jgi:hypothetical protein
VPGQDGTADWRTNAAQPSEEEILLRPSGASDIFRAEGAGYTFVTERAKTWFEDHVGEWVSFVEAALAKTDEG